MNTGRERWVVPVSWIPGGVAMVMALCAGLASAEDWTPARIASRALWLDASDTNALSTATPGMAVGRWVDKSGFGRDATNNVFGNQPAYGALENLCPYSEQLDSWYQNRATVSTNATAAPDGATTADKFVENTDTGAHQVSAQGGSSTAAATSSTWTASAFLKAAEVNEAWVSLQQLGWPGDTPYYGMQAVLVSLTNGALTPSNFPANSRQMTFVGASSTNLGGGWYRVTCSATTSASTDVQRVRVAIGTSSNGLLSYTGRSGQGIYVWGAQLNRGAAAKAYVATAGAAVDGTTAFNGKPALRFNGNQKLVVPNSKGTFKFLHNGQGAVFVVGQACFATNDPNAYALLGNAGPGQTSRSGFSLWYQNRQAAQGETNKFVVGVTGSNTAVGAVNAQSLFTPNTQMLIAATVDMTNAAIGHRVIGYVNGTLAGTNMISGTAAANDASCDLEIGGYAAPGFYLVGAIGEVFIASSVLSTDDRQKMEGCLAHKWGLAGQLPSNHPYKSRPPTISEGVVYTMR